MSKLQNILQKLKDGLEKTNGYNLGLWAGTELEILKYYISKEDVIKEIDDSKLIFESTGIDNKGKINLRYMQNGADVQLSHIKQNIENLGGSK